MWKNKTDGPGYKDWLENHEFQANYKGSLESMEPTGSVKFSNHPKSKKQGYTKYIGDGNSSELKAIR